LHFQAKFVYADLFIAVAIRTKRNWSHFWFNNCYDKLCYLVAKVVYRTLPQLWIEHKLMLGMHYMFSVLTAV